MFEGGGPNLYEYALSDPMSYYDDDGLAPKSAFGRESGGGGPSPGGRGGGGSGGGSGAGGEACPINPKAFNSNQSALVDLAKTGQRTGLTPDQSRILNQWANEYNIPFRGPEAHPGRPQGQFPHIHIGPIDHIRIIGE